MRVLGLVTGSLALGLAFPAAARVAKGSAVVQAAQWSETQADSENDDEIIDLRQEAEKKRKEEVEARASSGRTAGWLLVVGGAAATALGTYFVLTSMETKEGYADSQMNLGKIYGGGAASSIGLGLLVWGMIRLAQTSVAEQAAEAELSASTMLPKPTFSFGADGWSGGFQWQF